MRGMTNMLAVYLVMLAVSVADPAAEVIRSARSSHGAFGERAATFLVEHMPASDRAELDAAYLIENLELALTARESFGWAALVPEDIYFNDVLPYAVLDETREAWRSDYYKKATPIVREAQTATEAAQLLNRDFFDVVNVHYSTGRKRPNQSPSESAELGIASCTGLSIILVDACRAVGIPARVVGTPMWTNKRGNHTWVEIWDGGWHFVGADEYDAKGVDRGWFVGAAAKAREDDPRYAIYATSWSQTESHFPMVWAPKNHSVSGVNVTARYARPAVDVAHELGIRLFSKQGGRIAVEGSLTTPEGEVLATFRTRDEQADMNDMPQFRVVPGQAYRLRFMDRQTPVFIADAGVITMDVFAKDLELCAAKLSRIDIPPLICVAFDERVAQIRTERLAELESREITIEGKRLRWLEKTFGETPEGGRSLWISMHGGGGAPTAVNDRQWKNQINLYQPKEGIYIAPRAPTDAWDLWHQGHIDPLFERLIESHIALRGVNPNKVYLMGYSAGGDGVWKLAPRMADRFAAASMMAGHPNGVSLLSLYNLPFAIFMGGDDHAYKRNEIAAKKGEALKKLHQENPDGYVHLIRIYEGLGHWMKHQDREALPWMARFVRNPWPNKIVWLQDHIVHERFYWLKCPEGSTKKGLKLSAEVNGQLIQLDGDVPTGTRIRLSDHLVNLDEPVRVVLNGKEIFNGSVERSAKIVEATLDERLDPAAAACAEIVIN